MSRRLLLGRRVRICYGLFMSKHIRYGLRKRETRIGVVADDYLMGFFRLRRFHVFCS
jgi:hypothetical protein